MEKYNVIALGIHGVGSGLDLMGQDLVETVTLHAGTDNSCQILQCHL